MTIYKCDKCGEVITTTNKNRYHILITVKGELIGGVMTRGSKAFDLCEECYREFEKEVPDR